ncbi:MAG TPA: hypothetical protein VMJ31_02025, partial [Methylocystis sp.]|nr:hypothetical protein [Methylocystis sp.]
MRWPSEQGPKPQAERNVDRGALPDRAASKPLTQPTRTSSDRAAHPAYAALRPSRRDAEEAVVSHSPEPAPRQEPLPASPPRAPSGESQAPASPRPSANSGRQWERLLQDRFILEGLRQLGLAIAIVLVLGFVSVRMFSPREAGVAPAEDRASRTQSPAPATTTANQAPIPLPASPQLNVESDESAPAGQPAPLRLTVSDAPEGSTIVVSGVGPDTTLSAG